MLACFNLVIFAHFFLYCVPQKYHYFVSLKLWCTWINFDIFWHNVTVLRKQAMKRFFIFPHHLASASALPGEMKKRHPFTQMLYGCIARLQPVTGLIYLFIQSCHLQLMLLLLYDSLNITVSVVKLWTVTGAIDQEKGSWEFCTAAVGLCWMQDAPVHCLAERQNCYK